MILCGINIMLAVSLNLINGFTGQFSLGHAGFMAVGGYTAATSRSRPGRGCWARWGPRPPIRGPAPR